MTFNDYIPCFDYYMKLVDMVLMSEYQLSHKNLHEWNWEKQYKKQIFPQDACNTFFYKFYADQITEGW